MSVGMRGHLGVGLGVRQALSERIAVLAGHLVDDAPLLAPLGDLHDGEDDAGRHLFFADGADAHGFSPCDQMVPGRVGAFMMAVTASYSSSVRSSPPWVSWPLALAGNFRPLEASQAAEISTCEHSLRM